MFHIPCSVFHVPKNSLPKCPCCKLRWHRIILVFPLHKSSLCLWLIVINPGFVTSHDSPASPPSPYHSTASCWSTSSCVWPAVLTLANLALDKKTPSKTWAVGTHFCELCLHRNQFADNILLILRMTIKRKKKSVPFACHFDLYEVIRKLKIKRLYFLLLSLYWKFVINRSL